MENVETETDLFKSTGGDAKARYHDGIATVLKANIIVPTITPSVKTKAKRNGMLDNLTEEVDSTRRLNVNNDFTGPSTEVSFVAGNNFNEWMVCKTAKGEPLNLKRNKE